jgi:peptide/nickel transport system ATP-binding protein/oligopeptide transport system ATP-binding protein
MAVMYAGRVVETGTVRETFARPQHPYTRALLSSIPRLTDWPDRLVTIDGSPPDLREALVGCPFAPRCPYRIGACRTETPALAELAPGHRAACLVAQAGGRPNG